MQQVFTFLRDAINKAILLNLMTSQKMRQKAFMNTFLSLIFSDSRSEAITKLNNKLIL